VFLVDQNKFCVPGYCYCYCYYGCYDNIVTMSLHSADYIRNLVGHVPSKMLSLRQDEVSVFSRMNIQGRRRVSLPSKLSGITEKGSSDGRDIQESLNKSYSEMKNKLDELEEYNQLLEKQLSDIFSSISASVSKVDRQGLGSVKDDGDDFRRVKGGAVGDGLRVKGYDDVVRVKGVDQEEGKFSPYKGATMVAQHGASQLISARHDRENNNNMEDRSRLTMDNMSSIQPVKKLDKIILEEEDTESSLCSHSSLSITNDDLLQKKVSSKNSKHLPELGKYLGRKNTKNSHLEELLTKQGRTGELKHSIGAEKLVIKPKNDEDNDESELYEVEKHTFIHLVEDEIRPIGNSKKDSFDEVNRIANKENIIETSKACFIDTKNCVNKHKEYSRSREYGCLDKTSGNEENNYRGPRNINELVGYTKIYEDCHKHKRRISSVDHPPFSTLSEIKEEEKERRLSTGTMHSISNLPLGKKRKEKIINDNYQNNTHKHSSNLLPDTLSSTTIDTSSCQSFKVSEPLLVSPPEYLDFYEETDSVDEFFLFSEEVLNVNFETICQELASLSNDMGLLLDDSDSNSSYLRAAKASDEWKTLWIYRGM